MLKKKNPIRGRYKEGGGWNYYTPSPSELYAIVGSDIFATAAVLVTLLAARPENFLYYLTKSLIEMYAFSFYNNSKF